MLFIGIGENDFPPYYIGPLIRLKRRDGLIDRTRGRIARRLSAVSAS